MSKGAKFFTVIAVIISVLTAAEILGEIFSTKMNRYYKVDSEQDNVGINFYVAGLLILLLFYLQKRWLPITISVGFECIKAFEVFAGL